MASSFRIVRDVCGRSCSDVGPSPRQPQFRGRREPGTAKAEPISAATAAKRIDTFIADVGDWRGERLAEIRALIHEVDPDVVEEWKWMGTPVWSHDGMYVLANPHKDKVKLQFFHGAQLRDPKKLFNAGLDGGQWRAIDFFASDKIDRPALKALLREALVSTTHAVPKARAHEHSLIPASQKGDRGQSCRNGVVSVSRAFDPAGLA